MQLLFQFQSLAHHTRCTILGPKAEYRPTTVKPSNPTHLFALHTLPSLVAISHSKIMNTDQRRVNMLHETEQYAHCTVQIWHRNDILTAF